MALTVKNINSDASFLLTFDPIIPHYAQGTVTPQPFTVLVDPWITGPSKIFHPKISISTHKRPACISSLTELERTPDLVVISQHKSDHCNEATLRQLPSEGTKTLILAEPSAAKVIKSWKYFDREKVRTIERWEDPRLTGKRTVLRIPVPALVPDGQEGEVTVAFIPQKRDIAGLHAAMAITYRQPPLHQPNKLYPTVLKLHAPPETPASPTQTLHAGISTPAETPTSDTFLLPPTPPMSPTSPTSPTSLRSVRSACTLIGSPAQAPQGLHYLRPSTSQCRPLTAVSGSRPLSVIFSPHGISYPHLETYVTSHLVAEAALPLTALLHCMDSIANPWWLGGNICAGVPAGAEIASKLGARVWISAHDGEKDVRGLATGMLKTRRWKREEVEGAINPEFGRRAGMKRDPRPPTRDTQSSKQSKGQVTEIMRLNSGEEVVVSGEGMIWCSPSQGADPWVTLDKAEDDKGRHAPDQLEYVEIRSEKPVFQKKSATKMASMMNLSSRFRTTV
ncbi:hypothetical protein F4778DRAFT_221109 [Xylariomycetidae sp. FL2044]|nr:hypothetical protein F4778DRAFT_221109 [Xylariomycetidae sp. FL2044]